MDKLEEETKLKGNPLEQANIYQRAVCLTRMTRHGARTSRERWALYTPPSPMPMTCKGQSQGSGSYHTGACHFLTEVSDKNENMMSWDIDTAGAFDLQTTRLLRAIRMCGISVELHTTAMKKSSRVLGFHAYDPSPDCGTNFLCSGGHFLQTALLTGRWHSSIVAKRPMHMRCSTAR